MIHIFMYVFHGFSSRRLEGRSLSRAHTSRWRRYGRRGRWSKCSPRFFGCVWNGVYPKTAMLREKMIMNDQIWGHPIFRQTQMRLQMFMSTSTLRVCSFLMVLGGRDYSMWWYVIVWNYTWWLVHLVFLSTPRKPILGFLDPMSCILSGIGY